MSSSFKESCLGFCTSVARSIAPAQNQPVTTFELIRGTHLCGIRTQPRQHCRMRLEVSLHGQNSNLHFIHSAFPLCQGEFTCRIYYQPRVDSISFSSICRTSRPRMASP